MRLIEGIHLVASGSGGFGLTDPFDCHVYLVDGGSEAALVDAGIGRATASLLANVEEAGVGLDRVAYLLLTHAHPDHAGGAAELKRRMPWLQVVASPSVAEWVAAADEEAMSVEAGKLAEFYPGDFRFTASAVDRLAHEGERIHIGGLALEVLETPGHSDGHLAFLCDDGERVMLFGGDLVFFGGLISLANTWDCRIPAYAASVGKLCDAGVDALFPGHHGVSLREGQRHIDAANRLFERGFVPRSVV